MNLVARLRRSTGLKQAALAELIDNTEAHAARKRAARRLLAE